MGSSLAILLSFLYGMLARDWSFTYRAIHITYDLIAREDWRAFTGTFGKSEYVSKGTVSSERFFLRTPQHSSLLIDLDRWRVRARHYDACMMIPFTWTRTG